VAVAETDLTERTIDEESQDTEIAEDDEES